MADPIKMGDLWAAFGKPKAPLDMFGTLESQYGLPRGYLGQTYQIESGGNPYAQNPNSSAGGGFQFIDSTARQYGLTDKSNLGASADAAARLARDNAAQLRRVLGRDPTAAELYLAHQQGGGGASALLANPNAPAVDIVGADAVRLNGGNANMTAGEFANLWLGKFGNTPMPTNAGGGGMAGGNVTMSTMGGQQEQSPSIWNNLFGGALADPDKRARLAIALEGMTLNPNQALIQTQAEGIKSRADEKKAATEINRTAAWLRSQGRDDLAAAVESGALGGRDAAGIAMQPAQSNVPASFQALDLQAQAAGLKPGTPEYQQFMMTGGAADTGVPAAFAALDAQAQAAGFVPGSQEYKDFMATRGAGLAEAAKITAGAAAEAQVAAPADVAAADKALAEINGIKEHPGLDRGTGWTSLANSIPGTVGYDFQNRVNQVKSGAFLTAIDQMRGMGSLSNAEGQTATAAVNRMDTATSKPEFMAALADYEAVIKIGRDRAQKKIKALDTPSSPPAGAASDTSGMSDDDLINMYSGQ